MITAILIWLFSALGIFLTSRIVKGFEVKDFGSAMIASILVGLLNLIIRPLLMILTLPLNIITLGLFTFVVNAIVLRLAAGLMSSFNIKGWGPALLGALVLALINMVIFWFFPFYA